MRHEQLSFWQATSLMVGAGVGAGIMAVPYLAARTGFAELAIVLVVAYGATCLVHLLLAEVSFRTPGDLQLIELIRLYLLRGPRWAWLVWLSFILLAIAFLAALAAYVIASAEIVASATGIPLGVAELLVYGVSAGVVFFGLGAVGWFERLGAAALFAFAIALLVGAAGVPFHLPVAPAGGWSELLAVFGLVMYAYATYFSVPQVVKGLGQQRRLAARAIVAGLGLNGLLMAIIALVALGVSSEVTEVAAVGIADSLGPWAGSVGSLFILVALITTYWSVSLALADIVRERTRIRPRPAWLVATLPSLLILYLGVWGFLEWLSLAAGATAMVIALITVPMYVNARRYGAVADPGWTLGRWGGPALLALAALSSLLMAVGAIIAL